MANRVPPTLHYADNSSGSLPAACNVWRRSDADSMSARTTTESTTDAGYTTAGASLTANTIGQFLALDGESIYERPRCPAQTLQMYECSGFLLVSPHRNAVHIRPTVRRTQRAASSLSWRSTGVIARSLRLFANPIYANNCSCGDSNQGTHRDAQRAANNSNTRSNKAA